tara:strand:- start:202 stop:480 length:279 start_codon:yes stop_codon:yes gene_type:complete
MIREPAIGKNFVDSNERIRSQIIESGVQITGPELISRGLKSSSVGDILAYCFMSMQAFDLLLEKGVIKEDVDKFKDETLKLFRTKFPETLIN